MYRCSVSGKSGSGSEAAWWTSGSTTPKSVINNSPGQTGPQQGGPPHPTLTYTHMHAYTHTVYSLSLTVQVLNVFDRRAGLHCYCLSSHNNIMTLLSKHWNTRMHVCAHTSMHTHRLHKYRAHANKLSCAFHSFQWATWLTSAAADGSWWNYTTSCLVAELQLQFYLKCQFITTLSQNNSRETKKQITYTEQSPNKTKQDPVAMLIRL